MIESLLWWSFTLLLPLYAVLHWSLWRGSSRAHGPVSGPYVPGGEKISVIVAARNEERTIIPLLNAVTAQNIPSDSFEIIIVDDRSTDGTAAHVTNFPAGEHSIRLIRISDNTSDMPHKKNALRAGIAAARHDILAFTDADCLPVPTWLQSIRAAYDERTGAVAGYSPYVPGTAGLFLRYEELKNSIYAAGAIGAGHAYLCTGRNFSYRKDLYERVGGFEPIKHSVSGDDDLFLQVLQRDGTTGIRYIGQPEAVVHTFPPASFAAFVQQRTRHVSASTFYSRSIQGAFAISHLYLALLVTAIFVSPFLAVVGIAAKAMIDGALIAQGLRQFSERLTIVEFILGELLLFIYTVTIAPLGFLRSFEWKGAAAR